MFAAPVCYKRKPAAKGDQMMDQDEPPWVAHARALGVPEYPSGKRLRKLEEKPASANPLSEQQDEAHPREALDQPVPTLEENPAIVNLDREPQDTAPPRVATDLPVPRLLNPNPTAIRGWKSGEHLLAAIRLAGMPPPHELTEHPAGFLRYAAPCVLVNYYTTTRAAIVQGKLAGTYDERLRAARVLANHP